MKRRDLIKAGFGAAAIAVATRPAWAAGDVNAITLSGKSVTLSTAQVNEFSKSLKGELLPPDAPGYDAARQVWNGMWDRRPALIARCASTEDVVNAVQFARSNDLLLAVKSGGHSMSGQSVCDGGLVIDTGLMKTVTVDPKAKIAQLDAGCLLGDLDRATAAHALATTAGVVSHTGAAGLTLGGGMGRLQRKFGLTIDNVQEITLVTADGKIVKASRNENPDLFWALRGGGGNFGVATRFTYRLHDFAPMVPSYSFTYPLTAGANVLKGYFDYAHELPDAAYLSAAIIRIPTGDAFVSISGILFGDEPENERALTRIRAFEKPVRERVGPAKYTDLQSQADESSRHGKLYYAKAGFLAADKPALITDMLKFFGEQPMPNSHVFLLAMGGQVARVASDATAYPHRQALHNIDVGAETTNATKREDVVRWGRAFWEVVEPYTQGAYVNTLNDEAERRVLENWGGNYERLQTLKTKYDPKNLFRLNANIKPKSA